MNPLETVPALLLRGGKVGYIGRVPTELESQRKPGNKMVRESQGMFLLGRVQC